MLKSMNFLRGKSRGRVSGGTKAAPLVPVILCLVHRILWKQGIKLVNKLALLLNKCWSSMLGTFCAFFKYPSPADKSAPSPSGGEGMHRPWCHKILGTGPSMTGGRGANSFGRSMIEMLGVLAIIAVLSVGGIAGYSKAMEKYKLNRTVEQFNYLIQGMLEHTDSLRDKSDSSYQYGLVDVVQALNLVPETWERVDWIRLTDEMGDTIQPFIRNGNITIDFYLGGKTVQESGGDLSYAFSDKLCREIVQNVFYPLHSAARAAHVLTDKTYNYYGNSLCADGQRCLKDITPIEINKICKACNKGKQACILVLNM